MKYHIDDSEECATEHIKKIVLGTGKTYYVYNDEDPIALVEINSYGFFT